MHVVAYTDGEARGGAEHTLGTLLAGLDRDHEVTVVGPTAHVVEWVASRRPGSRTVMVPAVRDKRDVLSAGRLVATVRSLRPDVVHVNLATPWHGMYAQLAGLTCRRAVTVAVEHSPVASTDPRQVRLKRWMSSRVDAHVASGERLGREVERLAGLPPGQVRVIHNGIPQIDSFVGPRTRPASWPAWWRTSDVVVGSVGRLVEEKGFDILLRALAQTPGPRVVLVGEGPEGEKLRRLVVELDIAERVHFTGWSPDVYEHLAGMDVFCLPSYLEGFPLSTLEAMQLGIPVVATDVGGVCESVRHGETGLLVPPRDVHALAAALASVARDPEERSAMGERGRALVAASFTAPRMAARYQALYRELRRRRRLSSGQ